MCPFLLIGMGVLIMMGAHETNQQAANEKALITRLADVVTRAAETFDGGVTQVSDIAELRNEIHAIRVFAEGLKANAHTYALSVAWAQTQVLYDLIDQTTKKQQASQAENLQFCRSVIEQRWNRASLSSSMADFARAESAIQTQMQWLSSLDQIRAAQEAMSQQLRMDDIAEWQARTSKRRAMQQDLESTKRKLQMRMCGHVDAIGEHIIELEQKRAMRVLELTKQFEALEQGHSSTSVHKMQEINSALKKMQRGGLGVRGGLGIHVHECVSLSVTVQGLQAAVDKWDEAQKADFASKKDFELVEAQLAEFETTETTLHFISTLATILAGCGLAFSMLKE